MNTDFTRLSNKGQTAFRCSSKNPHNLQAISYRDDYGARKSNVYMLRAKNSRKTNKTSEKDPRVAYELKRSRVLVDSCPAVNSDTGHLQVPVP